MPDTLYLLFILFFTVSALAIYILFRRSRRRERRRALFFEYDQPYHEEEVAYTAFLIGDTGAVSAEDNDPLFRLMHNQLLASGSNSTVIFLGDNIYPTGLPERGDRRRHRAEKRIQAQFDMVKGYAGKVYYIGGNHDWNKGRRGGWDAIIRQEKYIEEKLGRGNVFLPDNGCMGPVQIDLAPDICLIIINTQWWVQDGLKPMGEKDGCTTRNEKEFFTQLSNLLKQNKDRKILIAAHHPLYSNALHGGNFTTKQHVFPLTDWKKRLYFPIPVIGSLYPLYRKVYGAREDMSHPNYRRMRKKLLKVLAQTQGAVYVAGHDHNLQHIIKKENHHLVSGSGSKVAYVRRGGKASFAVDEKGFFKLNYMKNGETWLEAWIVNRDFPGGKLVYIADITHRPAGLGHYEKHMEPL